MRKQIEVRVGEEAFNSWFGRLKLAEISGGTAYLSVPTAFLKSWLSSHYLTLLEELWKAESCGVYRVEIAVRSAIRSSRLRQNAVEQSRLDG